MCVDPGARGTRIGRRLYEERRALAERLELHGIVFGGRMANYSRFRRKVAGPQDYLDQVAAGKIHDPVIRFQLANGFEPAGVLENYLPSDRSSLGHAALMVWRNPYAEQDQPKETRLPRGVESVRVATCQLQARAVANFDEFLRNVEYFVDVAADYQADFIVFPELFTLQLLSSEDNELSPAEAIDKLSEYTPAFRRALSEMAIRLNINIIGGSHPTKTADGDIQNVAFVCLRDGAVHEQEKIHPTPNESVTGGTSRAATGSTPSRPTAARSACSSATTASFPELARRLADQGARILFTPFCTDSRQGYLRVRYCSAGAGDREPVLRRPLGQCRQPAQRPQHGHPVCAELHPHPLRLPVRARRHCRRGDRECRDL